MPRGYSHNAILLSGALASWSHQKVSPQSCWGSLLKPSQHSPAPYCFSASPLQEIRPEAHKNLMGEAGTVFCGGRGDCFILEPRCLISILATCSYLILHK